MINISTHTNDLSAITSAIQGKWDRHAEKDVVWAICGRIAIVEGNNKKFPFEVVSWHDVGSLHVGILGKEKVDSGEPGKDDKVVSDVAKILETARRLRVDLGNSRAETTFDGSSDVLNIQVDGVLSDENIEHSKRWNAHCFNQDNPHNVNAEQIGVYAKEETDQRIASAVSGVGTFLGSLSPTEINAIENPRVGDYADVTDAGYLNEGATSVIRGDCVVFDGNEWVKRLNDGKGLFVVDGQLRFG